VYVIICVTYSVLGFSHYLSVQELLPSPWGRVLLQILTVTLLIKKFLASDKLKGVLVLTDLDQAQAQALLTSPPHSPHHIFLVLDCSFNMCLADLLIGAFPHLQPEDSSNMVPAYCGLLL